MTVKTEEVSDLDDVIIEIQSFLHNKVKEEAVILLLPVKYIVKNLKQVLKNTFKRSHVLGVDEIKEVSKSIPELLNNFDSQGTFKDYSAEDIFKLRKVHAQIVLLKRIECDSTITLGYDINKDSLIIRIDHI